jgi:hypothetical protein
MKYYTKCKNDVQRAARKVLRKAVRCAQTCRCVDVRKLSDAQRDSHLSRERTIKRIIDEFERAKTDADLIEAVRLTEKLCAHLDESDRGPGYDARADVAQVAH